MSDFAALLRQHREKRQWNQRRCAEASGINHSLISMLESGTRRATRKSLAPLCDAMGLSDTERDELYLSAGFVPPDTDTDQLGRLIALFRKGREHSATTA